MNNLLIKFKRKAQKSFEENVAKPSKRIFKPGKNKKNISYSL